MKYKTQHENGGWKETDFLSMDVLKQEWSGSISVLGDLFHHQHQRPRIPVDTNVFIS